MRYDGVLDLGADKSGREPNAGKIGYGTFTADALDIVGAGGSYGARKVKIWDNLVVGASAGAGSLTLTYLTGSPPAGDPYVAQINDQKEVRQSDVPVSQIVRRDVNSTINSKLAFENTTGAAIQYLYDGSYWGSLEYKNDASYGGWGVHHILTSSGENHIFRNGGVQTAYISYSGSYIWNRLGVGAAPSTSYSLYVNGAVYTTSNYASSDRRLKANVEAANLDMCWDAVKALPLQRFEWNTPIEGQQDQRMLGWIAQDVLAVFPKAITTANMHGLEDCHNINHDQLFKIAYGGLQKAISHIEALETKVAALEARLTSLGAGA
jgi:hypothetical protein